MTRICAGEKHRFRRVDVPEAAHFGLVQENFFEASSRGLQHRSQIIERELITERLGRQFFYFLCIVKLGGPHDLHQAEVTLVLKDETAVIEVQDGVSKLWVGGVIVEQHELATHSKMRDQRSAIVEVEEHMFAAAMNEVNRGITQALGEFSRRSFWGESGTQEHC